MLVVRKAIFTEAGKKPMIREDGTSSFASVNGVPGTVVVVTESEVDVSITDKFGVAFFSETVTSSARYGVDDFKGNMIAGTPEVTASGACEVYLLVDE